MCLCACAPVRLCARQVKSLLVGDSAHRLTQLAEEQYERRITEGAPGSAAGDWEVRGKHTVRLVWVGERVCEKQ